MKVKIKKLSENAVIPSYAKEGDCGMDLTATSKEFDNDGNIVYGTGLALEIPEGYAGFIFPRSSNAKKSLILSNSVGIIDSKYRGELFLKFKPTMTFPNKKSNGNSWYEIGDRIGQLVILPYPHITFEEVNELSETERGSGGFGSSGS